MSGADLTVSEVCGRLGIDQGFLHRLVSDGVVEPSGGGGGQRGRRHRWTEADLGVLEVCDRLHPAGAGPAVLQRVVRYLHGAEGQIPFGMLLVVGQTYGPRMMTAETFAQQVSKAGEALLVLDLTPMRKRLSRRPASPGTLL